VPDTVHVCRGKIVKSGDKDLALDLEANGYAGIIEPPLEATRDRRAARPGETGMNMQTKPPLQQPSRRSSTVSPK
jgi:hypothetical protein